MKSVAVSAIWAFLLGPPVALSQIEIDPSRRTGEIVRFFGWDLKGWKDVASTPEKAKKLYGDTPANLVRISIEARAHHADGSVDESAYEKMLTSIANIRAVNPEVKIFAGLKLKKEKTFPAWVDTRENGTIFGAKVKCPDPEKYARLIADYIEWIGRNGVALDYLGLNNEVSNALTAERYVETAKALMKELEKRGVDEKNRSFQFVGAEGFGVPTSVRYAETIKKKGGLDYAHLWGSHFYPDKASGSIEDWERLARVGSKRPLWHTEIHVRESDDPAENIASIRDGLALLFKTNQTGVEGYVWWARAHEDEQFANLVRRKVVTSLLGGSCVKTSGHYLAKGNEPDAEIAQATRVGDTVWLWYFNPGAAKSELPIKLRGQKAHGVSGEYWTGGKTVTPQTTGTLEIQPAGESRVMVQSLPPASISLIRMELNGGAAGSATSGGLLIAEREWRSADTGSRTIRAALVSVEEGIGRFRKPDGSTFDYPLQKLSPEDRRVVEEASRGHGR